MIYLLDYSITIELLVVGSPSISQRFLSYAPHEFAVPTPVRAELLLQARRSQKPKDNLRLVEGFLEPLVSLPLDDRACEEYALLGAEASVANTDLSTTDLLSAAIAIANRLTLVTRNYADFANLPNLRLEWWRPDPR